jgi:hypothetical protein
VARNYFRGAAFLVVVLLCHVAWAQSPPTSASAGPNAFNPAISLILNGQYNNLQRDPATYKIGGFIPGGDDVGPGSRSFQLGESELQITANIDPYFAGTFIGSVGADDKFAVEEAFVTNTGFVPGTSIKFGRFYSGFGYLNEVHAHAWDFTDAPLIHKAFLGGQLQEEGVQIRWIAPADQLVELTAEIGRGQSFPGSERSKNDSGAALLSVHTGDDLGDSHSYRAGLSYRRAAATDREYEDQNSAGATVTNAFSGNSKMWAADAVWKWSPHGNTTQTYAKLQFEYFRRTEDGTLAFDTAGSNQVGGYHSMQSGWYLQGVYQFMPRWRIGARHDALDAGSTQLGLVQSGASSAANFPQLATHQPKRDSVMIDFRPSEFSQFRLQLARDQARFNESDQQIFLQYTMSLGAHGAHKF